MNFARWSVRNRVAVNLFTAVILIAGFVFGGSKLTRAIFPEISTNFIRVTTLDATTTLPEDIERLITIPLEEELSDVEGVTKMTSFSQDNVSTIFLQIDASITDLDPVLNEVRQAVDKAVPEMPASAEPPLIEEFEIPLPLVTLAVSYPAGYDVRKVRPTLESLERRLKVVPGVSDVLVDGLEDREIWVEIDPFRLQNLGLAFTDVADAIRRKNVNVVGGRMEAAGGERVIRVLGEVTAAEQLQRLPIKEAEGRLVLLRDVATVKETTEEKQTLGRLNMEPAITYTIVKKKKADAIDAVAHVREVFAEAAKQLPPEFETRVVSDSTKFINTRIETVLKNGVQALVLVTLLLILLLNWRLALVVAVGIPVSFAGAFIVLYVSGGTLNMLSLFGLIMALGMVVDDAIVVSENVYRYYESGLRPVDAAIKGAQEVAWPVIGSVSTTVAAFLPLIWGEGIIGKFLIVVPIVVISALAFSLLQAFLVLPSHLSDFVRRNLTVEEIEARLTSARGTLRRARLRIALIYASMRSTVDRSLRQIVSIYLHLLTLCLRWRYAVLGGFVLLLAGVAVALIFGVVRFQLFAVDYADRIIVKLDLPADYSLAQSESIVARVERQIASEIPRDDLAALTTRIGARMDPTNQFLEYGSNLSMIIVDIDEQNPAARKPSVIERDLNRILRDFPEFTKANAETEGGGPPVGRPINVQVTGPNFSTLQEIAADVEKRLRELEGVYAIENDFRRGKTELQVRLDEEKLARAKLDVAAVGQALQGAYRGLEAAKLRWGNDEVTIRVKMDERYARDPEIVSSFRLKNTQGDKIALGSVAQIVRTNGLARVKRQGQERMITVSGNIDDRATTSLEVNNTVKKWVGEYTSRYPGYSLTLAGENEDTEKSIAAMQFAAIVALLLIYALLATISNSFLQPFVIMSVIPFGIVGVVLGLMFMGLPLGLMSIMGTIALAGIVVNNSVVFVDFINRYRHQHSSFAEETDIENVRKQPHEISRWVRWHSILASGKTRFRPILLTTATTVVGLLGLAFTTSGQEQFLAPMAQAIVFGLSFASLLTMILIPCLYSMLDDLHVLFVRLLAPHLHAQPQLAQAAD